jgi:hypothetical protein
MSIGAQVAQVETAGQQNKQKMLHFLWIWKMLKIWFN